MKKKKFKYLTSENDKVKEIRFISLCKSCGLCLAQCPVKAISWDTKHLGIYNHPAIKIDLNKCIACGQCQRICPDSAIKIINKQIQKQAKNKKLKKSKRNKI